MVNYLKGERKMGYFILVIFLIILIAIIVGVVKGTKQRKENENARESVEQTLRRNGFNIEKAVGVTAKLYVDNTNKKWAINEWNNSTDVKIYQYSDLIDFELLEDNESIVKGGFGKALVGGALGGTTGAIIGSSGSKKVKQNANLLEIKIRTNDFSHPQYSIEFIKGFAMAKTSPQYKKLYDEAQEVIGVLSFISANGENNSTVAEEKMQISAADKVRELMQLKNEGIISEEEFEKKKKELLNL